MNLYPQFSLMNHFFKGYVIKRADSDLVPLNSGSGRQSDRTQVQHITHNITEDSAYSPIGKQRKFDEQRIIKNF